jgi:transcriptional regulator with XRE-family HTH domain
MWSNKPWGARLREIRLQKGLSQMELANKAELTQSKISQLEGRVDPPSIKTLSKLSKALGVSLNQLLEICDWS